MRHHFHVHSSPCTTHNPHHNHDSPTNNNNELAFRARINLSTVRFVDIPTLGGAATRISSHPHSIAITAGNAAMPTSDTSAVSTSGITTSATGERHIPASTRADGSVRKEIRVRPGYRPPEDVEIYKNRTAEAWKNRGKGDIPGAEGLQSGSDLTKNTSAANKNAKRREARKKAAAATTEESNNGAAVARSVQSKDAPEAAEPADPEVEREKEAKKLLKKLRQARDLKDKKDKGDALLPEQFEKVIKINELIRQLESIGFDANGEKRAET